MLGQKYLQYRNECIQQFIHPLAYVKWLEVQA